MLACGLGCLLALMRMFSMGFVGYLAEEAAPSGDPFYLYRALSGALVFIVLIVAGHTRAYSPTAAVLLVSAGVVTASVIMFAVYSQGAVPFALGNAMMLGSFASVFGSAALAILAYMWMMLLSSYPVKRIAFVTLGACALCEAILLAAAADSSLSLFIAVICAFVSSLSVVSIDPDLATCKADGPLRAASSRKKGAAGEGIVLAFSNSDFWFGMVMVAAIAILAGTMLAIMQWRYYDVGASVNVALEYALLFAGVACTLVIMLKTEYWERTAWLPTFALFVLALCTLFFVRGAIEAVYAVVMAASLCALYALWAIVPASVEASGIPHAALTATILLLTNTALATSLGAGIAQMLPRGSQAFTAAAAVAALGLLVVFAFCVPAMMKRNAMLIKEPQPAARQTAAASNAEPASDDAASRAEKARTANTSIDLREESLEGASDSAKAEHEHGVAGSRTAATRTLGDMVDKRSTDGAAETSVAHVEEAAANAFPVASQSPLEQMKLRVEAIGEAYQLTARETEVALLTAQGFSCAYIADKLIVSNSTVRYHQQNGYRKLGVHSRNELIEFVNNFAENEN